MKHIVKKDFDATEIPYPEMKQQLEIATILDKVSYVIKVREKELEELDTLIKSRFVGRFPELSLFYRLFSPLYSEMICIFPYFCPYTESARE